MKRHVTIQEVAEALDCSTKTVRRKVELGLIPAIQPGGKNTHLRFDLDEVLQAVKAPSADEKEEPLKKSTVESEKLSGPLPRWKQKQRIKQKETN